MERTPPTTRQKALAINLDNARDGTLAESTGRLFKHSVKVYVYPARDAASGHLLTIETAPVPPPWHHLRNLLVEVGQLETLSGYDAQHLSITPEAVLGTIQHGDPAWESMVPATAIDLIKARGLSGYQPAAAVPAPRPRS